MSAPPGGAARAGTTPVLDRLLRDTSRTFALTIPLLEEPLRHQVTIAYLLFRVADTLEDAVRWPRARKLEALAAFEALLVSPREDRARELARRWSSDPPLDHSGYLELLDALPELLRSAGSMAGPAWSEISSHTRRTADRMAAFVAREEGGTLRLRDLADLRDYCYAVAGIVGEMLTELFLLSDGRLAAAAPELRRDASAFGEALQLVNILKDAAEDAGEGRFFLPAHAARSAVFDLARGDLLVASRYCARLEREGAARGIVAFTALPVLLARATLDRVESAGPGAKISRDDVLGIVARLMDALDAARVGEILGAAR